MWRAAASSVSYLTDDLRKRQLEYTTIVTGRTEREARWKECIDISAGRWVSSFGYLEQFKKLFGAYLKFNMIKCILILQNLERKKY